jgi:MoaA/NifB/PqqE/SkfB family radical SAM enzyme
MKHGKRKNPPIDLFTRKEIVKEYNKGNPVCVNIEINERCAGGCLYCYASSTDEKSLRYDNLSFDKFKEILKLRKLGVKVIYLYGGDQLMHPHCKDMIFHAIEEGFHLYLPLAGLIPKNKAKWIMEASELATSKEQEFIVGIHLDTLDQHIYNQVNKLPHTLKAKIEGYTRLLNEGFPADRIYGCPTLTNQNSSTITELMDWYYSKGAKHIAIVVFRPLGLAKNDGSKWEPTLEQIEKAYQFRATIEGKHMLMVGSSDGKYACQSHIGILANGNVVPCLLLPDLSEGNIYQNDILQIVKKAKKNLLLKFEVKGPCATCISKLVCYGCRANAHIYLGDIKASDPKCFYNHDAPNKCL